VIVILLKRALLACMSSRQRNLFLSAESAESARHPTTIAMPQVVSSLLRFALLWIFRGPSFRVLVFSCHAPNISEP
jgi:hypothetical protein